MVAFVARGLSLALVWFAVGLTLAREWERSASADWQIVYESYAIGRSGSFVMAMDGTQTRSLMLDGHTVTKPTCSPDGETLAFIAGGMLYVTDMDDERPQPLTRVSNGVYDVAVSNGGRRLVYSVANTFSGYAMFAIDRTTDTFARLDRSIDSVASYLSLSPDGTRAAMQWQDMISGVYDLMVFPLEDRYDDRFIGTGRMPAWSPDGRLIAAAMQRDIGVMDAERGVWMGLNRTDYDEGSPAWSPDGRLIVYVWYMPMSEIHLMNADGTNPRAVGSPPVEGGSPCFLAGRPRALVQDNQ